jgi:hypothetical protein
MTRKTAARCAADRRLIFPDGKWDGIYRLLAERMSKRLGRSYSMDVLRAALGGKTRSMKPVFAGAAP